MSMINPGIKTWQVNKVILDCFVLVVGRTDPYWLIKKTHSFFTFYVLVEFSVQVDSEINGYKLYNLVSHTEASLHVILAAFNVNMY